MAEVTYLDFDLLVERSEAGYRGQVLDSPVGQASAEFALPFSELELETFLLRVGRPRRGVRRPKSPEVEAAREFGSRLFQAVFDDALQTCLRRSLNETDRQGVGLRIRLRLTGAPELADLPWEYLYDPALRRFLALSAETPVVRYIELPERIRPLAVKPPLRVLTMIPSPHDRPHLDVESEWANLAEALGDLEQRGLVVLDRLKQATLSALQRRLLDTKCHVFHYIGHGEFDQHTQDGVLLLEDEHGRGCPVSGQYLGTLLRDHRPLRLAILDACAGARASHNDPFAGAAQSLVQQGGAPAVIAMQFEVTDEAAITFAQWFYAAVVDGRPVDAALAESRKAIFAQGCGAEWGTPVLYMRAPDGRIFDVEDIAAIKPVRTPEAEPAPPAVTMRAPEDVSTNNLPVSLTSFVGREREMAEIKQHLSTARLLTLTGPGGCGKTRIALEVARDQLGTYANGVWWVELAPLQDPVLVTHEVASALSVHEAPGRPLTEVLADHLRPRHALLVLDNCEHLVKTCATLVDTLLRTCPRLHVLVTSRETLDIPGELVWGVPPLSLPSGRQDLPSPEELAQCEAVRLFVDRAQFSRRGFKLTQHNALPVVQICRRLDGLPLAIELAAARVDVLSVEQIAMRLNDRFRLLTRGRRAALPHHQTLRGAVDWSYNLLSEAERTLFNRLSVFAGGFTLEAAEAVGVGDGVEAYDVLDLLSRLVDKSLVVVETGAEDSFRYRLLETLRQYGQERLERSGGTEDAQRRHAVYFLGLVEQADPELEGPKQFVWLNRLEREHENLRAALRWARENQETDAGLRLTGILWPFWVVRGYLTEGWEWLTAFLDLAPAAERTEILATATNGAGALAYYRGDYTSARSHWETSLAIRRELGDTEGVARSLNNLGLLARDQGDYATAQSLWEESLEIKRKSGDKPGIATSFHNLGDLARKQGDVAGARSLWDKSLAIWRELGHQQDIAGTLNNLADLAYDQGDYGAARSLWEKSLATWQEAGHKRGIARTLSGLGNVAHKERDYATARSYYEKSLALSKELEDKRGIARSLDNLGLVARDEGDYATAHSLWERSLAIRQELGDKHGVAEWLERFAGLAAAQGQSERALRLAGAAAALRATLGAPLLAGEQDELECHLAPARQSLGEQAAARAFVDGQALTAEQAIECALDRAAQV
ncbi:MAG: tetratricopeptide repeat protein [Anaerolineae bacterium]